MYSAWNSGFRTTKKVTVLKIRYLKELELDLVCAFKTVIIRCAKTVLGVGRLLSEEETLQIFVLLALYIKLGAPDPPIDLLKTQLLGNEFFAISDIMYEKSSEKPNVFSSDTIKQVGFSIISGSLFGAMIGKGDYVHMKIEVRNV